MDRITVSCVCGRQFASDPRYAGQTMQCPGCGSPIQVPHVASGAMQGGTAAMHGVGMSVAAAESDAWVVRLPDGRHFGPTTYAEIKRRIAAAQFPRGTAARRQNESTWHSLDVQQAATVDLGATDLGAADLDTMSYGAGAGAGGYSAAAYGGRGNSSAAHSAPQSAYVPPMSAEPKKDSWSWLLGGDVKPYKPANISPLWTGLNIGAVALYGLWAICLGTVAVMGSIELGDIGKGKGSTPAVLIAIVAAWFCEAAALFQWDWFFNSRKANGLRSCIGDRATRYAYIALGWVVLVLLTLAMQPKIALVTRRMNKPPAVANRQIPAPANNVANVPVGNKPAENATVGLPPQNEGGGVVSTLQLPPLTAPSTTSSTVFKGPPPIDPAGETPLLKAAIIGNTKSLVTYPYAPWAFAQSNHRDNSSGKKSRSDNPIHKVRLVDLRDNSVAHTWEIPDSETLIAGSRDGKKILTQASFSKLILRGVDSEQPLSEFAEAGHIQGSAWLTADQVGCVILANRETKWWNFQGSPATLLSTDKVGTSTSTPGGNFIVDVNERNLRFFDAKTGKLVGGCSLSHADCQNATIHSPVTFRRDGKQVAVLYGSVGSNQLVVWDLVSRQAVLSVPLLGNAHRSQWVGKDYILCGDSIVGVKEGRLLLKTPQLFPSDHQPDDRYWKIQHGTQRMLVPYSIPTEDQLAAIRDSSSGLKVPLKKGDTVSLEMNFAATPPSNFQKNWTDYFTTRITRAGYRMQPNQAKKVCITVEDRETGRPAIQYQRLSQPTRRFGGAPAMGTGEVAFSVPDRNLTVKFEVFGDVGKVLVSREIQASTPKLGMMNTEGLSGISPEEKILQMRWSAVEQQFHDLRILPQYWDYSELATVPAKLELDSKDIPPTPSEFKKEEKIASWKKPQKLPAAKGNSSLLWDVAIDPTPETTVALSRDPFPLMPGRAMELFFSSPSVGQAVILTDELEVKGAKEENESKRRFIHRYDLRKKRRIGTAVVGEDVKLLDFRPDGQLYVTTTDLRGADFEIWKCAAEGGSDSKAATVPNGTGKRIQQAFFAGKNVLVTVGTGHEIVAYRMPKGEQLYEHKSSLKRVDFSWGRRYFVNWSHEHNTAALYRTEDGTLAGKLAPMPVKERFGNSGESSKSLLRAAAFRPDGKRLACLYEGDFHSRARLGVWNLENGQLTGSWDVEGETVRWTTNNHLLVKNALFDIEAGRPVWNYYDSFAPESPDGRGWFVETSNVNKKPVQFLAALPLPSSLALEAMKKSAKARSVPGVPSFSDISSVALDLQGPEGHSRRETIQAQVKAVMEHKLAENQIRVDPNQSLKLSVQMKIDKDGSTYEIDDGKKEWIVDKQSFSIHVVLQGPENKGIAYGHIATELPDIDYRLNTSTKDPSEDLLIQQENATIEKLRALPLQAGSGTSSFGLGGSHFDLRGERLR